MVLSPTKDKPPLQTQCILGLTLDTDCNKLALKEGKADALAQLAKEMQDDNFLSISDLRSIEGNIMWLGFVIHGARGFASPIIEAIKICDRSNSDFDKRENPQLNKEVEESLSAVMRIARTDPWISTSSVTQRKRPLRTPLYQDASGFQEAPGEKKCPTPGRIDILFPHKHPKVSFGFFVDWFDIYKFLNVPKLLVESAGQPYARPGKSDYRFPSICFLEYLAVISNMLVIALSDLLAPKVAKAFRKRLILFLTDNQSSLP